MKEREQGRVMPFGLSGMRLRTAARDYRRRGQVLEALSLVRRAALQDDTAAGWQALAAELRQLGCWEASAMLLGRVLSRVDAAPSAWLDMARCMSAQGSRETAEDCLYHLLHEDPWSAEADAARQMLADMGEEAPAPSRRAELLNQRVMTAWQRGEAKLALRRMRRLIRLSPRKSRLMAQLALLYMVQGDAVLALRWLTRAVKADPADAVTLTSMAAVLQEGGRRRMARGFLRLAACAADDPAAEERVCSTAWLLDAWPELAEFLSVRLKRTPYRIPLLHAKANMLCETGDTEGAQQVWKTILSVDPDDRAAVTLLEWSQQHPGQAVPRASMLPAPLVMRQRRLLPDSANVFTWGSPARRALDWFTASPHEEEEQLALAAAALQPDRQKEIAWLREVLTRPDVQMSLRQHALMRLAALGHFEELNILMGGRYVAAQCQPTQTAPSRRMWHMFLPALLRAGARYSRAEEVVSCAARLWPLLTPQEKQEAATTQTQMWSRIMAAVTLWQQGRSGEAEWLIQALRLPQRRVTRLLSRMEEAPDNIPGDAGEGDTV